MKPLIDIRSIPMSVELKINNATYELVSGDTSVEITRDNGGLQMRAQPAQLKIDTFEARNSTPFKTAMRSNEEFSQKGIQAAYKATANFAKEGNMLLNIHVNDNILADIAYQRFNGEMMGKQFNISFTPSEPIEIEFTPHDLYIKYEMDKLNFDWKINRPEMEFTPGNIEIIIKEYARIEIEYIGSPIYVPPSADPNNIHNKIDTKA